MKSVHVRLIGVRVAKFTPKDGSVELSITFSNDKTKEILKTEHVTYPESLARRILADIRRTIKSAHQSFDDGEILDDIVNVVVDDEDAVEKKLIRFMEQMRVNISKVQNMKVSDGYVDAVRAVSTMSFSLQS